MPLSLNTSDPLYASLSRLFCVDDDNSIKELVGGLAITPHANVKTPGTTPATTTAPFGRSFRTTGTGGTPEGVDFAAFPASNAGAVSVFVVTNQYNGGAQPSGDYGTLLFGADSLGVRVGTGLQIELPTGKFAPHNNNSGIGNPTLVKTAGSVTSGAKSFGFTRNGLSNVFAYIDGAVDSAFAGGVSNSGSAFGANWSTSEMGFIGGNPGAQGWVSFDIVYIAVFVGVTLTESDFARLHASLTGGGAFALVTLPVDTTPPTLTGPTGTSTGSTTATGTVSTNEATGTLYRLASINATESAATVKAAALTQPVSATGSQAVSFAGLSPSTTYYPHYVHIDAAGNESAVADGASPFVTAAAGDTTAPVLTGAITVTGGSITTTGWQANWPSATDNVGVASYDISTDGGATWPTNWPVNNYTFAGYSPGTTYLLRVRARDAAGNLSAVISGSVTTALPTITTDVMRDENNNVRVSHTVAKVIATRLSDLVQVCTWTNQVTSSGGVLTLAHASLTGVPHIVTTASADGAAAGAKVFNPVM